MNQLQILLRREKIFLIRIIINNDHLGSTSVLTNESGGIVEETFYEPFGGIVSGGNVSHFYYEGKDWDSIINEYDFNFRKYNPELLIFTKPDSGISDVYDPQALNRYSFERNNPYKYVDPNGKSVIPASNPFDINNLRLRIAYDKNFIPEISNNLQEAWEDKNLWFVRGLWNAFADPYYKATKGSVELIARASYGKNHPFASKDTSKSIKDIAFGGVNIGLTTLGGA
jgi:RHS repeat-associated protein